LLALGVTRRVDFTFRFRGRRRRLFAPRRLAACGFTSCGLTPRHGAEPTDEIGVVAFRLVLQVFDAAQDRFDAIKRGQNERDGIARDRHAIAEFAHQALGRVGQPLEPRQSQEAARAFDSVNEAENIAEDLSVVRLLLEAHELGVDAIQTFAGFGQEIPQQLVHTTRLVGSGAKSLPVQPKRVVPRTGTLGACGRRQARQPDRTRSVCCQSV
jgi:hypothetical protein